MSCRWATIFKGDMQDLKHNGFGDLKMSYLFVPFSAKGTIGLENVHSSTSQRQQVNIGWGERAWLSA
jgi:hypothetical protein